MHQTCFEDLDVGSQLPSFTRTVAIPQLVRYAGASRDFATVHYDYEQGKRGPWGSVILHGMLKSGFLAKVAGDLAGTGGVVRYVKFLYRQPDFPGDTLVVGGSVARKHEQDGDHIVECDLWLRNGKGEVTTTGTALVALPARADRHRPGWAPAPAVDVPGAAAIEGEKAYADLDEIRRLLGVPWKPWVADISGVWIGLFARAVSDMNPLYIDDGFAASGPYGSVIAPPTFLGALDPFYRCFEDLAGPQMRSKPGQRPGGNGWDEFELFGPIRPGDVISSHGKWTEPYEKPGRSGTLVFVLREIVYVNQRKETVARSRGALISVVAGASRSPAP